MIDLNTMIQALEKLIFKYGIPATIIFIVIQVILFYLLQRLRNEAKVPTEKYLAEIRNILEEEKEKVLERYKKEIQLMFRDENVRNTVITSTIIESNRIRIDTYKAVYALFFEVIYSITNLRKQCTGEREKGFLELFNKVTEIRKSIFINSVQMGRLTDFLLHSQISLWDNISKAKAEADYPWINKDFSQKLFDASEELHKAEKWIQENLKTTTTLRQFELSKETLQILKNNRDTLIEVSFKLE